MPRDASGAYTLPTNDSSPAAPRNVIRSSDFNELTGDYATALTDSLSRSGDGAMLANLDFGGFAAENATNIPALAANTMPVDNAGGTARETKTFPQVRNILDVPVYAADRTALKALDTTNDILAYLKEDGREGVFRWTAGDFSAHIATDTQEGVYIKADAIASTVGAWVRQYDGGVYVEWFGAVADGTTNSTNAFQVAADLCSLLKLGRIYLDSGTYLAAGVTYGPFSIWTGPSRGATFVAVPAGADTFQFKSIGFDDWADSVPANPGTSAAVSTNRGYSWNSSTAARNAAAAGSGYVVGSVVVTRATNPGLDGSWFNGEQWWLATSVSGSGFADTDANWTEKSSLLGAISSGFEGITFSGNAANQVGNHKGLCHYGVASHFESIFIKDFGDWGMFREVPGGVFSAQVGIRLQGRWNMVDATDCGTATSGNIYDNGQSDETRTYTKSYQPKNLGFMHYLGAKAGGGRHYGFHYWNDDASSNAACNWAIYSDAQASDWHGHAEARCRLSGARHSGEFKIYKGSSTFRVNDAALYLESPSYCSIVARTFLFRNCFKIVTADGGFNDLVGLLAESVGGTAVLDTTGIPLTALTSRLLALNGFNASDRYQAMGPQALFARPASLANPAMGDAGDPDTGYSFSSQGAQIIFGGVEKQLVTGTENIDRQPRRSASYTVATLPTSGISVPSMAYASDGRKVGEGAGAGTGVPVYRSNGQWRRFSDDTTVVA